MENDIWQWIKRLLFNLNFTFFAFMQNVIIYTECPACKSNSVNFVLAAKDYIVSQQMFEIWQCNYCSLRFTQNVPSEENISSFYQSNNYISHSDTKQGIINRLYHSVRNITLQQKKKLVQKTTGLQKGTLLDIGAGTGAFAAEMKKENWLVTALEPDEAARNIAKTKHGLELQASEDLFVQNVEIFDAITLWHVLEHVHTLNEYLHLFEKVLKPNGRLLIAVPNYPSFDATYYKEYWAAYDVPRHLYHFSPKAMKRLLFHHGFDITSLQPMPFDSYYVSMLSEQCKRGKNNFFNAFWVGLQSNLKAAGKPDRSSSIIYIAKKKG
ncbi:MAG: class I SAM-dependent methyltransferase [Bacteroidota bacterium]|nr:class I SAM-dependent methyltransferase [Bacteroidota bacterium]